MNLVKDQLEQLCDRLTAAGVEADYDPQFLNPDCAWVSPRSIEGQYLDGTLKISFDIYLITPEADITVAVGRLDDLLQRAISVVGGMITDTDLATNVTMLSGAVCPAMKLTIQPPRN